MINTHLENALRFPHSHSYSNNKEIYILIFDKKLSGSHFEHFKPFTLNSCNTGQLRYGDRRIVIKTGVRSQEVVVSDEEGSQDGSAVGIFESAPCTGMELVGTVEAFDELLEWPV